MMITGFQFVQVHVHINNVVVNSMDPDFLVMGAEPSLINLVIKISHIIKCLSSSHYLKLTNDLISRTETEKRIVACNKNILKKCFSRAMVSILEKLQHQMLTQIIWKKRTKVCPWLFKCNSI